MVINMQNIKKILIIKLCCIGDIIQTIPSLKAFKNQNIEIHFLCNKWVDEIVDMIPFVDKKIVIDTNNFFNLVKTIFNLRKERYDLVVNFHRDLKSYLFVSLLGSKIKAGFIWNGYEKFLDFKFTFDCKIHESLRYLAIAEGLGFKRNDVFTELKIPEIKIKEYEITGEKKVGLFPGGGKNPGTFMWTKRWSVERYIELARLLDKKGISVYFFGGEMDRETISKCQVNEPSFKTIITKSLKELAFYISQMDVFVAGDTGPLHMAAALRIKTIGLFGPTSPELVAPLNKNSSFIWGKENCSPCYVPETVHRKEFLKCQDNKCMKNITVEKVFLEIISKLGK